jgi:hypothetical protein
MIWTSSVHFVFGPKAEFSMPNIVRVVPWLVRLRCSLYVRYSYRILIVLHLEDLLMMKGYHEHSQSIHR